MWNGPNEGSHAATDLSWGPVQADRFVERDDSSGIELGDPTGPTLSDIVAIRNT